MEPGLLRDALTVVLGVITGVVSSAFGIGGAVLSTPGVRFLGLPALVAVGTTLPSIFPSAIVGTVRYSQEGMVDWRVVLAAGPPGVVTSVLGSLASHEVPGEGHWLMVVTAGLVGVTAVRMAARPGGDDRPQAEDEAAGADEGGTRRTSSLPLRVTIGAVGGLLSGLLGVGGGVILLPAFLQLLRLSTKRAVATSLACVGILAVPGTISHAALGGIDWRYAFLLTVGVMPGSRLGAVLAIRASDRRLRLTVATALGILAVVYGVSELRSALG